MKELTHNMYMRGLFAAGVFALACTAVTAATIGHWRFDEAGAVDGAAITTADSEFNNAQLQATNLQGSPEYSNNVPGAFITDGDGGPLIGSNGFSIYAGTGTGGQRIRTPNHSLLDATNFTMEFFVSIESEFPGYQSVVKRASGTTARLNFDHDHASNTARFGGLRAHFMENNNQTNLLHTDGPNGQIYVDTASNNDDPGSYGGGDAAAEGNGIDDFLDINGVGSWHHVAVTYDDATTTANFYLDYNLMDTATISNFTWAAQGWEFGKVGGGASVDVYVDEPRLSDQVLTPAQFLRATNVPEPSTYAGIFGALVFGVAIFIRRKKA